MGREFLEISKLDEEACVRKCRTTIAGCDEIPVNIEIRTEKDGKPHWKMCERREYRLKNFDLRMKKGGELE